MHFFNKIIEVKVHCCSDENIEGKMKKFSEKLTCGYKSIKSNVSFVVD